MSIIKVCNLNQMENFTLETLDSRMLYSFVPLEGAECTTAVCDKICDQICDLICDTICDEICSSICDQICDVFCDIVNVCDLILTCDRFCDKVVWGTGEES